MNEILFLNYIINLYFLFQKLNLLKKMCVWDYSQVGPGQFWPQSRLDMLRSDGTRTNL